MRKKLFAILNKIYAIVILIAFFAGLLPLFPFIIAIIIGGKTAEKISLFIYNQYYPWVIAASAVAVLIGLMGMYVGELVRSKTKKKKVEQTPQEQKELNNVEETLPIDKGPTAY